MSPGLCRWATSGKVRDALPGLQSDDLAARELRSLWETGERGMRAQVEDGAGQTFQRTEAARALTALKREAPEDWLQMAQMLGLAPYLRERTTRDRRRTTVVQYMPEFVTEPQPVIDMNHGSKFGRFT